jgi:hypothetical protein
MSDTFGITIMRVTDETGDTLAIRMINATLDSLLSSDDMAKMRVLQYCEQKIHDKLMKLPESSLEPVIGLPSKK